MADQSSTATQDKQDQQQSEQWRNNGSPSGSSSSYDPSYDTQFTSQIFGGLQDGNSSFPSGQQWSQQVLQAYLEQCEQTIRSLRRVTDIHTLYQMQQQITSDAARQVVAMIRSNPSLLKSVTQ